MQWWKILRSLYSHMTWSFDQFSLCWLWFGNRLLYIDRISWDCFAFQLYQWLVWRMCDVRLTNISCCVWYSDCVYVWFNHLVSTDASTDLSRFTSNDSTCFCNSAGFIRRLTCFIPSFYNVKVCSISYSMLRVKEVQKNGLVFRWDKIFEKSLYYSQRVTSGVYRMRTNQERHSSWTMTYG